MWCVVKVDIATDKVKEVVGWWHLKPNAEQDANVERFLNFDPKIKIEVKEI
jgi:hypothetical protein